MIQASRAPLLAVHPELEGRGDSTPEPSTARGLQTAESRSVDAIICINKYITLYVFINIYIYIYLYHTRIHIHVYIYIIQYSYIHTYRSSY